MHEMTLLQDLAVVMCVCAVTTVLFHRLRLPVVLGYILAGVIIGPYTPPFPLITDTHSIHTLSELGIIFLLFSIGLEFSFTKLFKVGFVAVFGAFLEILLMIGIGYALGRAFGWNFMNSLFLGAILSISSTTIIVKVLMEMKKVQEKFAQMILGILIVEDLLAIVIIAILSGLAVSGTLTLETAGAAMLQVTAFIAGVIFIGYLLVPRLLAYLDRLNIHEMLIVSVVGLCFAAALTAFKLGFSVALGAFLAGAIIAETRQGEKVVHAIEPIRDMFSAVFFVSVGMLIDPRMLAAYWLPILLITTVTILGKVFSCSLAAFLMGNNSATSLKVGLGLAQIGEFSFIIARLGESTEVTSSFLYPIAVSVSGITTLTTPFLMRNTVPIIAGFRRITPQPLATFLGLYTGWAHSLGRGGAVSEKRQIILKGLKYYAPRLIFYILTGLVLFYGLSQFQLRANFFTPRVFWIALTAGIFPLLMGAAYTLERILWNVLFLNLRSENNQSAEVSAIFHALIRFFLVMLGVLLLAPVAIHVVPSEPIIVLVLLILAFFGFLLWGSMSKLHDRIEDTVLSVFERESTAAPEGAAAAEARQTHEQLVHLIREEYPWEVETADFLMPFKECALNQRIRDLRLRGETGASIVAVYRGDEAIPNPSPDTLIQAGDVLLLMGDKEKIQAAMDFLHKKVKEPMPGTKREGAARTQPVRIEAGTLAAGRTIKDLKLRRKTGASILGIQKGPVNLNNPDPETLIEAGDVLLLFGWGDEIDAAVQYLNSRP